jgi:hypothetical protein
MRSIVTILALAVSLLVLATGCAPGAAATPGDVQRTPTPKATPTEAPTPQPTPKESEPEAGVSPLVPDPGHSPLPEAPVVAVPAEAAAAVEWARTDLAARAGIAKAQISLLALEAVEWRDSSLGCPQPGMMYAQVITPGYLFVLGGGDQVYTYHAASGQDTAIFCESGTFQSPLPKPPEADVPPEAAEAVELAKADLAEQAGIVDDEIVVFFVQPIEWPDASLGCPQPGQMYAQVITPGFQVVLVAHGRAYDYHTDTGEQAVQCAEVPGLPVIDKPLDGKPWVPVD